MRKKLAWISVSIGGIASFVAFVLTLQFFFVPRGAAIRPMDWAVQVAALAGFAFIIGVPTALYALFVPPRRLAVVGLILSLLPYPLSGIIMQIAASVCGFTLSP